MAPAPPNGKGKGKEREKVIEISSDTSDNGHPSAGASSAAKVPSSKPPIQPVRKMFKRQPLTKVPKPKLKPKPSAKDITGKGKAIVTSPLAAARNKVPRAPVPTPPSPTPTLSTDDEDDDDMEEVEYEPSNRAADDGNNDDDELHPAIILQREREAAAMMGGGKEAGPSKEPVIYKDGKGGNAPLKIDLAGDGEFRFKGKDKANDKKRLMYTPEERLLHLNGHKLHTIALLASAARRNRAQNGPLLKARLLSLLPPRIPALFARINPALEPNQAKRGRMFEKALTVLVDHWAETWESDWRAGIRGRTWTDAASGFKLGDKKSEEIWGGELIRTGKSLQKRALIQRGSRDVSAQLFVGVCRSLGLGTRLIVSLQGVGWRMGDGREEAAKDVRQAEKKKKGQAGKSSEASKAETTEEEATASTAEEKQHQPEAGPSKPVRWIERLEGQRFPGMGNNLGVVQGKRPTLFKPAIPKSLQITSKSRGQRLSSGRRVGERPEPGDPFTPLSPPVFWVEVYSRPDRDWIAVDPVRGFIKQPKSFEPHGEGIRNRMTYVVALEEDGSAKDITAKYASEFTRKTSKLRVSAKRGDDWWGDFITGLGRRYKLQRDLAEDAKLQLTVKKATAGMPTTLAGFKNHPEYVLERDLKREEVIFPKVQNSVFRGEPVYRRSNVIPCKTPESWLRLGREVKDDEEPIKLVKVRAVTINRRREIEAAKENGEEEVLQGLFSEDQTQLRMAPPIVDGKIIRNSYGNFDLFTPTMLPPGAVHLPYKGISKIARQLDISYADACTGFEFKKQRAIPILEGIVVAEENEEIVMEAFRIADAQAKVREADKKRARAIKRWERLITGMRIKIRLQKQYGDSKVTGAAYEQETGIQDYALPAPKHIKIRLPDEDNSRRFEAANSAAASADEVNAEEAHPGEQVVKGRARGDGAQDSSSAAAKGEARMQSSDDDDEAEEEDDAQQQAPLKPTIAAQPAAVPKSLADMLGGNNDGDVSSGDEAGNHPVTDESPHPTPVRRIILRTGNGVSSSSVATSASPLPVSLDPPVSSSSRLTRASTRRGPARATAATIVTPRRQQPRRSTRTAPSTSSSRKRRRGDADSDDDEDEVSFVADSEEEEEEEVVQPRRAAAAVSRRPGLRMSTRAAARAMATDQQQEVVNLDDDDGAEGRGGEGSELSELEED